MSAVEEEIPKSWLFSKEEVQNSPSVRMGITFEEERAARKAACKFIAEVGQNLWHPASIVAINSAKVFLNRHFMVESLDNSADKLYNRKLVGITCLFVACKTEECLRPLKEFIWAWNQIDCDSKTGSYPFGRYEGSDLKRKLWCIDEETPQYQKVREDILLFERELLHVLGFDFQVDHPQGYIMRFAQFFDTVKREKESRTLVMSSGEEVRFTELGHRVITTANAMANDSSSTTLGIQFKSSAIAAVCMCLALKTLNFKSPSLEKWAAKWNEERLRQADPRLQSVVIVTADHQDICNQLLDFYDEIERQNAVSAQAAVVATSEQQPACTSSQRADAAPMATLPDLKPPSASAASAPAAAASAQQPVILTTH